MNIIAEIGINHNGDIEQAKRLIDLAVIAGFDFVKFQKRTPELSTPEHKKDELKETPWGGMTYLDYKRKIEFNEEQYEELFEYCRKREIECFASVWDSESAYFMSRFTEYVKIPSALITNISLLELCEELFEFKIMSTGMSNEAEIFHAVQVLAPDVIMHTNSTYPSPIDELNLDYITWLVHKYSEDYNIEIGYSGHEYGLTTTFAAAAMGAEWIERHITLDHELWGSDQKSSVDPVGCIKLVRGLRDIEQARGGYGEREILLSEMSKLKDLRK